MTDTHDTPKHTDRNTKVGQVVKRQRARSWCFTVNNYTDEDIDTLTHHFLEIYKTKKYIFQEEIGKNDTPHLQGVVNFVNPQSFNAMKKISPTAHWEICRNLPAALNYCSKEDTRAGKIYTNISKTENIPEEDEVKEYCRKEIIKMLENEISLKNFIRKEYYHVNATPSYLPD